MILIVMLVVVFALLWVRTVKKMYGKKPSRSKSTLNHLRISKVSHRQYGAWDPDHTNKSLNEPLIDQATRLVEETASREFRFKGTH